MSRGVPMTPRRACVMAKSLKKSAGVCLLKPNFASMTKVEYNDQGT